MVAKALCLDDENGNTYWSDAIKKEMGKAKVSYISMDGVKPEYVRTNKVDRLHGFQEVKCYIIFDIKVDFTQIAWFVAGSHMTKASDLLKCSFKGKHPDCIPHHGTEWLGYHVM